MKITKKKILPLLGAVIAGLLLSLGILLLSGWDNPDSSSSADGVAPDSSITQTESGGDSSASEESGEESMDSPSSEGTESSRGDSSSADSSSSTSSSSSSSSSSAPPSGSSNPPAPPPAQKPDAGNGFPAPAPSEKGEYVVGYYSAWSKYNGLPPSRIQASKLTHLNYAFADLGTDGRIRLPNPELDKENFAGLRELKRKNPHLKTLISLGGWDYSANFSKVASSAAGRAAFAESCADFILEHGFDGVDIDWEFPAFSDRQNFTLLLQSVREKLNQLSAAHGRPYYLTIAYSPSQSILNRIEAKTVAGLVDFIFLMGYDLHGPWDSFADFNAPLYSTGETSPHYTISLQDALRSYQNAGVDMSKLVLGMPFYGYQYATTGERWNGLYSPFQSAKSISYDKIVENLLPDSSYQRYFHEAARVPYLYDGVNFVTYDDESSIAEKTRFARANGLAGVGAWELSHDKNGLLLASAYNALYQK